VTALVENAVKYSRSGPIVAVLERAPGRAGGVRIAVRDTGPGVGPEHLPHLFARFYRAPEARAAPGAGLGLALVERVARAHGGGVSASPAVPHGLEVAMLLPSDRPSDRPNDGPNDGPSARVSGRDGGA
jgi:two-component system sensor histidine kinase MprB